MKTRLFSAVVMMFLLFCAGSFIAKAQIGESSGEGSYQESSGYVGDDEAEQASSLIPSELENMGFPDNSIKSILMNLITWLLGIAGILALIGFVVSGIQYFMGAANEEMVENAKKNFTYSVIGITVVLASFVIIQAIEVALKGTSSLF
jgi:hypothetical protein